MKTLTRHLPNWSILLIDLFVIAMTTWFAFNLRFDFNITERWEDALVYVIPGVLLVRGIFFYLFRSYSGLFRFTGVPDVMRIMASLAVGSFIFLLANLLSYLLLDIYVIPIPVVAIEFLLTTFMLLGMRLGYRILAQMQMGRSGELSEVVIYGAGEAGLMAKRAMDKAPHKNYKVLAFVDDNPGKRGKRLEGIRILHGMEGLDKVLEENSVDEVILAIQDFPRERMNQVVDVCLAHDINPLNVPPASKWINGELSYGQMRKVKIDELLPREPIELDQSKIQDYITGKRVLVTGAAGSIGSELVRQCMRFKPELLILVDQAETPLFFLEQELCALQRADAFEIVIGDVRNEARMDNVFRTFHPEVVFHAAAYKHVPMMEKNPSEAVRVNVEGTKIMADLSRTYAVEKFVFVSTDKAVNPTNVMGASKRIAEMYVQSMDTHIKRSGGGTRFITTRFGNVLGSEGSVIQLFKKQIAEREPLTVTHPDVTRYFMTIPEAAQLVLEAGAIGNGGEIFLFDMGESVKIADLARRMIELSGLEPDVDIPIVYTGMREGEKLYEELLNDEENVIPTHHPKIMVGKVREYEYADVQAKVQELIHLFTTQDNISIVRKLKEMIPEYVSRHSEFESLDKPENP